MGRIQQMLYADGGSPLRRKRSYISLSGAICPVDAICLTARYAPNGAWGGVGRVQQMLYADAGGVAVFVSRKKARVGSKRDSSLRMRYIQNDRCGVGCCHFERNVAKPKNLKLINDKKTFIALTLHSE